MSRYLITSALPYINGIKHLGNLAGSMLPADVHARFRRLQGHEVLFICATDEHGTPAELAAAEAGQDVRAYCDAQYEIQKDACAGFKLSFDWFGRSSNGPNHKLTQHFCEVLEKNGLIEERVTKQIYSIDDRRFLPDRYVEGTCPVCGFERARGDQCDNCQTLLDPIELKNPRSKISGSTNVEARDTAHLFLLQPKMQDRIRAWVDKSTEWPQLARSIAYKWLDEGLIDRSITRDLSWGIKVTKDGKPRPGFENKVFYVWFDAPVEYIGSTVEWSEATGGDWERWWREDKGAKDVTYVEFMGKDNVAFHTVSFPVTIMGSGEPWKLVDRLKAFNWVTWYGGKFSTSEKRGVFMDQALELLPSDYWRWYLMANAPESSDAAFTLEQFQSTTNADLADNFGNLVNRITRFTASKFESKVPDGGEWTELEENLWAEFSTRVAALTQFHHQMEMRKAAAELRAIWAAGNGYLQKSAPWTAIKTDVSRGAAATRTGINYVALSAILAQPFIPDAAKTVLNALGIPEQHRNWPSGADKKIFDALPHGLAFTPPDVLFKKIEDEQVAEWSARFGSRRVNLLPDYAISDDYERQVRNVLTHTGRAHVANFLRPETAKALYEGLRGADWWLAYRDGDAAVEANLKEFEALDVSTRVEMMRRVNAQAGRTFQYMFDKVRIAEKAEAGERPEGVFANFFTALNSEHVLKHFRAITAEPNIVYADAMASRYRLGHFLTLHHDETTEWKRLYAYVINLTPHWRADWGGLLQFVSRDGHIAEAFTPVWNALNIFHVPQAHSVSIVAPYAKAGRYAITGWLRADKP